MERGSELSDSSELSDLSGLSHIGELSELSEGSSEVRKLTSDPVERVSKRLREKLERVPCEQLLYVG